MTLARCKAALLRLIDDQENRVIALSGKWGTGKTELWKQVRGETVDAKAKDAVLVSLFGVSTITELKLKIAEGLAPKLGEGHFDAIKAGIAGFKKVLKGFHSSFSALDELSLLAVPFMLKGRFIVIDDIERKHTKLTIDEILGFIDECVQNHECRILLVLNSDKLEDQKLWGQTREKVVDQEIKLKETGDVLSVIPGYTLNSSIDWQAMHDLSLHMSVAWYGKQTPKKYDYHGDRVTGTSNDQVAPYAVAGMSGTYIINSHLSITAGVDNVLDERKFRPGNAQGGNNIDGAGAATYNEPGRTLFTSLTTSF